MPINVKTILGHHFQNYPHIQLWVDIYLCPCSDICRFDFHLYNKITKKESF